VKFIKLYELKIFTAEDVLCEDEPFFKALFKEARRLGLGGGTMIRADAGYGQQIRGQRGRAVPIFFSGSYNLPLIIEIVDTKEKLATLYPFLEKYGEKHFMAVLVPLTALYTKYVEEGENRLGREAVPLMDEPDC
jgi:PII-like signaling protein